MKPTAMRHTLLAVHAVMIAGLTGCHGYDTCMSAMFDGIAAPECRTYNYCALSSGNRNIWVICSAAAPDKSVMCYLALSRDGRTHWAEDSTGTCEQVAASLARSADRPALVLEASEVAPALLQHPCAADCVFLTELQRCSTDQRLDQIQTSLVSHGWELSEDRLVAWRPAEVPAAAASK